MFLAGGCPLADQQGKIAQKEKLAAELTKMNELKDGVTKR